jgi:hypothetical protein
MKKKSGHRRRTKIVRKSRKNLRRTIKRKSSGKSRRRPTRRYSLVQRGGEKDIKLGNAEFVLAVMYDKKNMLGYAAELYKRAGDNGVVPALYNLAVMYSKGQGVEKNEEEAARLYRIAGYNGDADAEFNLGVIYENGEGVEKDLNKAMAYYRSSANNPTSTEDSAITANSKYLKMLEGLQSEFNEKKINP